MCKIAATFLGPIVAASIAQANAADALHQGFLNPPQSARPLVWWHWMGGNVTPAGIDKDLAWMQATGLAGVQLFEGSLGTPTLVSPAAQLGTPAWQAAIREAVAQAHARGLEIDIASGPGWSETGGPWVSPENAMKKLVWSDTTVVGGGLRHLHLAAPPDMAGPFQDEPISAAEPGTPVPRFYRDVRVIAFPAPVNDAPLSPSGATSTTGFVRAADFTDGSYDRRQIVPFAKDGSPVAITLDFGGRIAARAFSIALPSGRGFGAPSLPRVTLQASLDGKVFSDVADVPTGNCPQTTVSFPELHARYVRVVLASSGSGGAPPVAAGVQMPQFGPASTGYTISRLALYQTARVNMFEDKAGFGTVMNYDLLAAPDGRAGAIPHGAVRDLTKLMRADGSLDWQAPEGRWAVLRLGYALTGHRNGPAAAAATGLEADKLDVTAVAADLTHYLGIYRAALGEHAFGPLGIGGLLNDSIEAGPQNWTTDMLEAFQRQHGYDPVPFLPALTGTIIDSTSASDAFLYDFRTTIADLLAERHYGTLARVAHAHGMIAYGEALEDRRPQLGDDEDMRRYQDVPMGAMWMYPAGDGPSPTFIADDRGAASVAHLWGRPTAGAESFTMFGQPWATSPRDLQPVADLEFALGINRIMIHESTGQPWADRKPGMTLSPLLGQYFNRNETWAAQAGPFITYLARNAFMLQQGTYVADIAYLTGEEAPLTGLYGAAPATDVPAGYAADYVNATALLSRLHVLPDGRLGTDGGPMYRALYLGGDSARMTVPVLRRIAELVRAGATVIGMPPDASRSLADDPVTFAKLRSLLWGYDAGGETARPVDKGHVIAVRDAATALSQLNIPPDLLLGGRALPQGLFYIHRHTEIADIYFISNQTNIPLDLPARFRVARRLANLWHADTGVIERASARTMAGGTEVGLKLAASQSILVVLTDIDDVAAVPHRGEALPVLTLTQPWQLRFEPAVGDAPPPRLESTGSWTSSRDEKVRHFSGTGIYSQRLQAPASWLNGRAVLLDLGDVRELAEVVVNGKNAGVLWRPPFRADIGWFLHAGANEITVRVTNLWVNRLIGDAQPGVRPASFTVGQPYQADAPLRVSGLIGPVRILVEPALP